MPELLLNQFHILLLKKELLLVVEHIFTDFLGDYGKGDGMRVPKDTIIEFIESGVNRV